ncbi:HAD-IA family hydrolase [Sphingomonas sp. DT-51]|uniref:HAD-IA family hydrolase n=1 Tax=Sphingomonas sp. DT-51 TaxID=3396165 RepID=UPI003F1A3088
MEDVFSGTQFSAFLFDMDGTLLTSIEASRRVWGRWAAQFGLDADTFLPSAHGMRVKEVITGLSIPNIDVDREAEYILAAEMADTSGVSEISGAADFLSALPADRWAIVTSAPRKLAECRLRAAGLPLPRVLVTAEDVQRGKPDPSCFLTAAQQLGAAPEQCLVFEDAPAGVAAAKAAGAHVVAITAAHRHAELSGFVEAKGYTDLRIVPSAQASSWSLVRNTRELARNAT